MKTENTGDRHPHSDQIILKDSTKPMHNQEESVGTSSSRQQVYFSHPQLWQPKIRFLTLRHTSIGFFSISFQARQQQCIANDNYRQQQQQQQQHSTEKYSRMNHVPRTSSSGRIRSTTTTPTAIASSAISQPVPAISKPSTVTTTADSTAGTTNPSNNPKGGDSDGSEHKPSTDINKTGNAGFASNGYEIHLIHARIQ